MTIPPVIDAGRRERIRKNIAAYKAAMEAGTHTQEDLDAYLAEEKVVANPEAEYGFLDRVGDAATTVAGAVPFGNRAVTGYQALWDLLPGGDEVRPAREAMNDQRDAVDRTYARSPAAALALQVVPGMALPAGPLKVAARAPGLLNTASRVAARGVNAGVTGGLFGASAADVRGAGLPEGATSGAGAGVAVDAGLGLLGTVGRAGQTVRRVAFARPLDEAAFAMNDAMRAADAALYGATNAEARALGTTPEIRAVLESQTVKPFADRIRASETFSGLNDAEVLLEAYKGMSAAQRRAGKSIEGTADFLHDIELRNADIGKAKRRMLDAVSIPDEAGNIPLPSALPAIRTHRRAAGEYDAFMNTSDDIRRILENVSTPGKKLLLNSPEALRREIAQMTPSQARAALDATLGRAREAVRFTANPVGQFGIVASTARAARAPFQIDEFVRLLEQRAGIPHPRGLLEAPESLRKTLVQMGGRGAGSLLSQEEP